MFSRSLTAAFVVSTSIVLLVVGTGKLLVGFGPMDRIQVLDPILGIQFRFVMQAAGLVEIACALACLARCRTWRGEALLIIAWLATNLALYRIALWCTNWRQPCNCMGYLTKPLHLSPQAADNIMKLVLGYMLIGSYAGLCWWWANVKQKGILAEMKPPADDKSRRACSLTTKEPL